MSQAVEQDYLAERYGGQRRGVPRGLLITAAATVAVVLLALLAWLAMGQGGQPVRTNDIGYEVNDDNSVSVVFEIVRPDPSIPVRCSVQALDAAWAQMGVREVEIPASAHRVQRITVEVNTTQRAINANVVADSCVVADSG